MELLLLCAGLVTLVVSGEILIRCAVGIAIKASIPPIIIGLTIVSIGTSAPEVIASVRAAWQGNPGIAIGNVIGSNIANLALILGITALIRPMSVDRSIIRFDWPVLIGASLLFAAFASDGQFNHTEGLVLLSGTFLFLIMLYLRSKNGTGKPADIDVDLNPPSGRPLLLLISGTALSGVGLYFGSAWLIDSASALAMRAGVSEHIIGLTAVAFGTSIPELVASGTAALKGESDLAMGNLIGSNILNIFLAIGLSASVITMPVDPQALQMDLWWMIGIALLILPFMAHRLLVHRWKGIILLLAYAVYIGLVLLP